MYAVSVDVCSVRLFILFAFIITLFKQSHGEFHIYFILIYSYLSIHYLLSDYLVCLHVMFGTKLIMSVV